MKPRRRSPTPAPAHRRGSRRAFPDCHPLRRGDGAGRGRPQAQEYFDFALGITAVARDRRRSQGEEAARPRRLVQIYGLSGSVPLERHI